MWRRAIRALLSSAVLLAVCSPSCVIRLSDRNAPLPNGGVTGPNADCSVVTPLPEGAPAAGAPAIKYIGRFDFKTDPTRPHFDWSGNYMNARFQGTEVTWGAEAGREMVFEMIIDPGTPQETQEQVILGGKSPPSKTVTKKVPDGVHEITVIRSSEALFGDMEFIPFTFGSGTKQLPYIDRPRRIEYIGDSITCGYGDEGPNATCPYDVPVPQPPSAGTTEEIKIPETQNIYLAYGSLAARRLNADAVTLCFSGKGVVLNYREQGVGEGRIINPDDVPDPDAKTTIPQYYLRTIASLPTNISCHVDDDCTRSGVTGKCVEGLCRCKTSDQCCTAADVAKCEAAGNVCAAAPANTTGTGNTCRTVPNTWDFTKEAQPSVVVINIGTNDFARDVDQNSIADGIDLDAFRKGYLDFVKFVRTKRPKAEMFLALPPMVTDKFPLDNARTNFRNTLNSIVQELNAAGDTKVYFIELVEMGVRYGLGCDYHPNLEVHRIMADQVAGAIHQKTCW